MKNEMINAINEAINNGYELYITMETPEINSIDFHFVPEAIDVGDISCAIYYNTDMVILNLQNVYYDKDVNEFICPEGTSFISVSIA